MVRIISIGRGLRGKIRVSTIYTRGGRICRFVDSDGLCGGRILRYCLICLTGGISMDVSRGRWRWIEGGQETCSGVWRLPRHFVPRND